MCLIPPRWASPANQGTTLSSCLLFSSERRCLKRGQGSAPVVTVPRPRVETACLRVSSLCREPTGLPCRWAVYLSSQPWEVNQRGVWVRLLCQKMGYDTCLPWNIPLPKAGTSCPCDWERQSTPLSCVHGLHPWGLHSPEPGSGSARNALWGLWCHLTPLRAEPSQCGWTASLFGLEDNSH